MADFTKSTKMFYGHDYHGTGTDTEYGFEFITELNDVITAIHPEVMTDPKAQMIETETRKTQDEIIQATYDTMVERVHNRKSITSETVIAKTKQKLERQNTIESSSSPSRISGANMRIDYTDSANIHAQQQQKATMTKAEVQIRNSFSKQVKENITTSIAATTGKSINWATIDVNEIVTHFIQIYCKEQPYPVIDTWKNKLNNAITDHTTIIGGIQNITRISEALSIGGNTVDEREKVDNLLKGITAKYTKGTTAKLVEDATTEHGRNLDQLKLTDFANTIMKKQRTMRNNQHYETLYSASPMNNNKLFNLEERLNKLTEKITASAETPQPSNQIPKRMQRNHEVNAKWEPQKNDSDKVWHAAAPCYYCLQAGITYKHTNKQCKRSRTSFWEQAKLNKPIFHDSIWLPPEKRRRFESPNK